MHLEVAVADPAAAVDQAAAHSSRAIDAAAVAAAGHHRAAEEENSTIGQQHSSTCHARVACLHALRAAGVHEPPFERHCAAPSRAAAAF